MNENSHPSFDASLHVVLERALCVLDGLSDPIVVLWPDGNVAGKNLAYRQSGCDQIFSLQVNTPLPARLSQKVSEVCGQGKVPRSCLIELGQRNIPSAVLHTYFFNALHILVVNLKDTSSLLQKVIDTIPARVFWKDRNSIYLGANADFLKDCEKARVEDIIGLSDYDLFSQKDAEAYRLDDAEVVRSGRPKIDIEEPQTLPNGKVIWLRTNKIPLKDSEGNTIGLMGSYHDITEQVMYRQLIEKQAFTDTLTQLHNRFSLANTFDKISKQSAVSSASLFVFNLNKFKEVNDTLGHQIGDQLLISVANRIASQVSCIDLDRNVVYRLGGDEFAVLQLRQAAVQEQECLFEHEALEFAHDVCGLIEKPFNIENNKIYMSVSVGIAHLNVGEDNWSSAMEKADLAMCVAKEEPEHNIAVYREEYKVRHEREKQIKKLLNTAIRKEELCLNIQPQYDSHNQITAAEILLRWHTHDLGWVSPAEFIPLSEQSGDIVAIGDWVLQQAFELVFRWSTHSTPKSIALAVNISVKQLEQHDFIDKLQILLKRYPIRPSLIRLEITESLLITDGNSAVAKITKLQKMGFPIEIDDFGTGYSSLSYLSKLPIDRIKIDRSFISNLSDNKRQALVLEALINVGKSLQLGVLAEGIETKEQLRFLKQKGCEEYQGFYFSKPLSVKKFEQLALES